MCSLSDKRFSDLKHPIPGIITSWGIDIDDPRWHTDIVIHIGLFQIKYDSPHCIKLQCLLDAVAKQEKSMCKWISSANMESFHKAHTPTFLPL